MWGRTKIAFLCALAACPAVASRTYFWKWIRWMYCVSLSQRFHGRRRFWVGVWRTERAGTFREGLLAEGPILSFSLASPGRTPVRNPGESLTVCVDKTELQGPVAASYERPTKCLGRNGGGILACGMCKWVIPTLCAVMQAEMHFEKLSLHSCWSRKSLCRISSLSLSGKTWQ